jgi:hypothetical protein
MMRQQGAQGKALATRQTPEVPVHVAAGSRTPVGLRVSLGGETTLLTGGAGNNRPAAILFRRTFEVGNPPMYRSLHLDLLADDGVQVFLNGSRVFSRNVAPSAHEANFAFSEVPSAEPWVLAALSTRSRKATAGAESARRLPPPKPADQRRSHL